MGRFTFIQIMNGSLLTFWMNSIEKNKKFQTYIQEKRLSHGQSENKVCVYPQFTMGSTSTSHSAKHAPFSSTLMKPSNTHPNHRKEDITYFLRNRVLTLGGITILHIVLSIFIFTKSSHPLP